MNSNSPSLSLVAVSAGQLRIGRFGLAAAFAGLGVWGFAKADYGLGAFWVVLSVAWLLMAVFSERLSASRQSRRADQN